MNSFQTPSPAVVPLGPQSSLPLFMADQPNTQPPPVANTQQAFAFDDLFSNFEESSNKQGSDGKKFLLIKRRLKVKTWKVFCNQEINIILKYVFQCVIKNKDNWQLHHQKNPYWLTSFLPLWLNLKFKNSANLTMKCFITIFSLMFHLAITFTSISFFTLLILAFHYLIFFLLSYHGWVF